MRWAMLAAVISSCAAPSPRPSPQVAAPAPAAIVEPVADALVLHVVAQSDLPLDVHGVGEFAVIDLGRALRLGGREGIEDIAGLHDPKRTHRLHDIGGSWPRVWALSGHGSPMVPQGELLRWSSTGWQRVHLLAKGRRFLAVEPLRGGVLTLEEPAQDGAPHLLRAFDQPRTVTPPRLERMTHPHCATRIWPYHLRSLDAGEVFVAGTSCDETPAQPVVERWDADGEHTFEVLPHEALPGEDISITSFVASSANHAFAGGYYIDQARSNQRPWLVRFDGRRWMIESPPVADEVRSMAALPDGTVLVLGGSHDAIALFERSADGRWSQLATRVAAHEGPIKAHRMWASSRDQLWIVAERIDEKERRYVVLHPRALATVSR